MRTTGRCAKGAGLRILAMHLDTTSPTGRLMLQVLGAVAEFERAIMLERQCEGIAKAKAEGRYRGRAKTAFAKAGEVETMLAAGITIFGCRETGQPQRVALRQHGGSGS